MHLDLLPLQVKNSHCSVDELVRSTTLHTDTNRLRKYLDFEMSPILLSASAAVPPPVASDPAAAFLAAEQVILPLWQPYYYS